MLVLIRHGETTANAAGLLLGRHDVELTSRGRVQAEALAPHVASASLLLSSPLRRALDTADGLGLGLPARVDERWVELDYGTYDGVPVTSVPAATWRAWRADLTYRPGGGETLAELGARVRRACEELFGVSAASDDGGVAGDLCGAARDRDVVVVTHTSPIKAAVAWAIGVGDVATWRMHLSTGSITRIDWASGAPLLRCFNVVP
jgi:broad specificity phosphatase PhoE